MGRLHGHVLRLSYRLIVKATKDLFGQELTAQTAEGFVTRYAAKYRRTEESLLVQILKSPAVHVDETKISILGSQQYVWVITDGKRTVFRLTESRETDFLRGILGDYQGVLVSDFYGGYDALPYRQQRCLVHLIGDLNDDLWKNPFNIEFEDFVASVRDLLVPILADVQKFGLKAYHLRKHLARVERFYTLTIQAASTDHELVTSTESGLKDIISPCLLFLIPTAFRGTTTPPSVPCDILLCSARSLAPLPAGGRRNIFVF